MRLALIVALLVGCLVPDALAQSRPIVPRIGVLDWESPDSDRLMAFRTALRDLGHVDGSTIEVDYRYAEGRTAGRFQPAGGGALCRSHPEGRQGRRPARRAADDVRACGQPEDGQGIGHGRPAVCPRPRR